MTQLQQIIKRTFDIVGAFLGLLFLFPFACIIIIVLKCSSKGPIFYKQVRIGQFGKTFRCVKFRTMSVGSDNKGTITTATDSRITPIGKFLRRYKLDEFPQLWNVLMGRMSFVGPRPDVPGYADTLVGKDREMLALKPGITGPASIFFRYEEELLACTVSPKKFNDQTIWPLKVKINLYDYNI